ncbi:flavodoxin [Lacticaseibacillus mingshuiensis]|uniref:Flavodoxin n=1 Tax=Lacticaseibacillus mingshuiensis TaxID=2799574 RepID=A0ABW4CKT5_9LACO|nr:flavodoxin [Lacticaseibacillus mingshuiensis]
MADIIVFSLTSPNWRDGVVQETTVGNTALVAAKLSATLAAPVQWLTAADPYPAAYEALVARAKQELASGNWPALAEPVPQLTGRHVFLGFPIWNGDVPPLVQQWLSQTAMQGVTVSPFVTHEGSGLGNSMATLHRLLPANQVTRGLAIRGGRADKSDTALANWLACTKCEMEETK